MKTGMIYVLSIFGLGFMLSFQNCSPATFEVARSQDGVNKFTDNPGGPNNPDNPNDPDDPNNPGDPNDPVCYVDEFNQPDGEITRKIDLLFVTDTSGSLNQERAAAAQGIVDFVAGLNSDPSKVIDYRVAVMLAHGSKSSYSGRLWRAKSEPYVLDSKTMSLNDIRAYLEKKLTVVATDSASDGGEEGLFSLNLGLNDPSRYTQSQSQGFFRKDAGLSVVFLSDENDICAAFPAGVTPVPDPEGAEISSRARDCGGISANSVYSTLKSAKGSLPLLVSSIVYTGETMIPTGDEDEKGYGYLEITALSNGLTVDLGGRKIAQGLADIGKLSHIKLNLITEHKLKNPGEVVKIGVQVDNKTAQFNYQPSTREVHLLEPGQARSNVKIGYCTKP